MPKGANCLLALAFSMKKRQSLTQGMYHIPCVFFIFQRRKLFKGVADMGEKLKLYGFNNLTKALSFNIYDVCYAKTAREQQDYIAYIDNQYNSERLTNILTTLTDMIGAQVLNIARQDYEPQGASVNCLSPKVP
jgi:hypothetical protein